jgi:hypothetical protein
MVSAKFRTHSTTGELVRLAKLLSPSYVAVRLCVPAASVDTFRVASPLLKETVPRLVLPSEKTTEPVGAPTADDTFAVSTTVLCSATGFGAAVSPTVGVAFVTLNGSAAELLATKFVSPANEAVKLYVPGKSEVMLRVEAPLERGAVPRDVDPL